MEATRLALEMRGRGYGERPVSSADRSGAVVEKGYRVHGRVQGVGFRWSTTRTARELGLAGTVRNRADGTVEVHARGPEPDLRRLEEWLHEGPRPARVDRVEEISPRREWPSEFRIVR